MRLVWDESSERLYETGVSNGVLYPIDTDNEYSSGVAWNGLTGVTESPSGAEATVLWADNIKYLTLYSAEDFGATVEAYMYPDEWAECDGSADIATGVAIGQQSRKTFGLCYRTELGNDTQGDDYGYKLHIIYGCKASPSERAFQTINDSPEAITFSWEITTTPVNVSGKKPTANVTIDSTKVPAAKMAALEAVLYGITADVFSPTSTYKVGDYVKYTSGSPSSTKTYVCKTAITTASAWDDSKWDEVDDDGPRLPLPDEIVTLLS